MQDVRHALLLFFAFVAALFLLHYFYDSLSRIFIPAWALFCLLGIGDPASETAACEVSVCSESAERDLGNLYLSALRRSCP